MLTALFAILSLAHAVDIADFEDWTRANLSVSLVEKFITNEKCNSNPDYLNSCREALRAAQIAVGAPVDVEQAEEFERTLALLESSRQGLQPAQVFRARVINAHLAYFDAHARLRPSAWIERKLNGTIPNDAGIGVLLESSSDGLVIREVTPGSPAQRAGLKEEDLVRTVSKQPLNNDLDAAAKLILGKAGSELSLGILREGRGLEFSLKRARFAEVTGEIINGVGYVRVPSFGIERVCKMVLQQLNAMTGIKGLILDLRGNPGGDKSAAICVAELFLGPKNVVGTQSIKSAIPALAEVMHVDDSAAPTPEIVWEGGYVASPRYTGPLTVLVDARSASSAEIVAGALQDYNRAWIVGERTFGKGTVQSEEFIPEYPTLTLKYTVERFYQPLGRSNQGVGISPSFEVPRRLDRVTASPPRESDLYPRMWAMERAPWAEPRPWQVLALKICLNSGQSIDKNLARTDYQKAYALGLLGCGTRLAL